MNEALTIQKPHRRHVDTIEKSTDEPFLRLLLNVAHAASEIPSTLGFETGCVTRARTNANPFALVVQVQVFYRAVKQTGPVAINLKLSYGHCSSWLS